MIFLILSASLNPSPFEEVYHEIYDELLGESGSSELLYLTALVSFQLICQSFLIPLAIKLFSHLIFSKHFVTTISLSKQLNLSKKGQIDILSSLIYYVLSFCCYSFFFSLEISSQASGRKRINHGCYPSIPMMWLLRELAIVTESCFLLELSSISLPWPLETVECAIFYNKQRQQQQQKSIACCTNCHPNSANFGWQYFSSISYPSSLPPSHFRLSPSLIWIIEEPLNNWSLWL